MDFWIFKEKIRILQCASVYQNGKMISISTLFV